MKPPTEKTLCLAVQGEVAGASGEDIISEAEVPLRMVIPIS